MTQSSAIVRKLGIFQCYLFQNIYASFVMRNLVNILKALEEKRYDSLERIHVRHCEHET